MLIEPCLALCFVLLCVLRTTRTRTPVQCRASGLYAGLQRSAWHAR